MTAVRYAIGHVPTIVTAHGVVVLGGDMPAGISARVWAQVADGRGLAAVLDALTGAFGTSLAALPPFAVALAEAGGLRLAVRGELSVVVESPSGAEEISGSGVTTWSERVIAAATRVTIATEPSVVCDYPVRDGVVLASAVEWSLSDAAPSAVEVPAASEPEPAPVPQPAPIESAPIEAAPVARGPWSALSASPPPPVAPPPPAAAPEAAPDLIDSLAVPSASSDTLLPQDSTFRAAPLVATGADETGTIEHEAVEESTTGYDHLWGATIMRSVEDAAVRESEEDAADASVPGPEPEGDHDGATISLAQARALRGGAASLDQSVPPLAPPRAPAPGRIRLSTGHVQQLDRTVVIGRRPRSTRVSGTDLPHLIAVDSPQQDISRSHLELRVEGDSIVATDLNTTNGSLLHRAGAEPVRLHPGEVTVVVPGDVIDLGDGITVAIEELD